MKMLAVLRRLGRHIFAQPGTPIPTGEVRPAQLANFPEGVASERVNITAGDIDGLATALDALPTDWNTDTHGHKYIETQENGISHRYVIGTVCKGKSRINVLQEPARLGDDTN
ncbi:hypothetical protein [Cardiobacterium valvarum]|uniref:Uncharacterized protein n=1 Tax=Cardiobacterium valvarum TaxID=194702 RepID=A0A381E7V0_9GAMM|nr:hypothetical protein [Cardiobacterium valvarum]SUX22744.1 Uncharacterised protein [Cardiobacterium valvarum]